MNDVLDCRTSDRSTSDEPARDTKQTVSDRETSVSDTKIVVKHNFNLQKQLKDRVLVADITKVPARSHLRYFIQDPETKRWTFRLGGYLVHHSDGRSVTFNSMPDLTGYFWTIKDINHARFYVKTPESLAAKRESDREKKHQKARLIRDYQRVNEQYQAALEQQNAEIIKLREALAKFQ